ncbi:MAG: 50S ribosomal protein L6 [Synergistales bacterium 58_81]|nr:MAG: 50S ribosomal protein L6 [Synergistales bacterium 58_81]HCP06981.1 50S ribosomal protein L6 [Synergistaceae bacterium]
MSRIGRKLIDIPSGVSLSVDGGKVKVKGPKGELSVDLVPGIDISVEDSAIKVTRQSDDKKTRAYHGMMRALVNNLVQGVSSGFERQLEIVGVGWRAQMQGKTLVMNLGFSHPVEYTPPEGVEITTDGPTKITVKGIDKQAVGHTAAVIRGFRPPEPYKGKGIRYVGEHIIRKAGKAGA